MLSSLHWSLIREKRILRLGGYLILNLGENISWAAEHDIFCTGLIALSVVRGLISDSSFVWLPNKDIFGFNLLLNFLCLFGFNYVKLLVSGLIQIEVHFSNNPISSIILALIGLWATRGIMNHILHKINCRIYYLPIISVFITKIPKLVVSRTMQFTVKILFYTVWRCKDEKYKKKKSAKWRG